MQVSHKYKHLMLAAGALAVLSAAGDASAQTQAVTVTVNVDNTLTLAAAQNLNFGVIAANRDTTNTATVTVNTAGVGSVASGGAGATTAIINNANIDQAQITVAGGANGATINVYIDNVVNPVNGPESFALAGFTTSYNGGAPASRTAGSGNAWTQTYDSGFGGGTNTLDIGATITTTNNATTAYTDGTYAGSFNVIFSY